MDEVCARQRTVQSLCTCVLGGLSQSPLGLSSVRGRVHACVGRWSCVWLVVSITIGVVVCEGERECVRGCICVGSCGCVRVLGRLEQSLV